MLCLYCFVWGVSTQPLDKIVAYRICRRGGQLDEGGGRTFNWRGGTHADPGPFPPFQLINDAFRYLARHGNPRLVCGRGRYRRSRYLALIRLIRNINCTIPESVERTRIVVVVNGSRERTRIGIMGVTEKVASTSSGVVATSCYTHHT